MRARRFALVYGLVVCTLFCALGYEFNDDRPSVTWGLAGCVAGTVLAVILRRRTAPER
ncbi:hypothetical protein ACFQ7A_26470 [Streptomyces sp. NPDC056528]|uniref:hypothetical protein n=1 Tax=Streptomyces sp. NPDC056528 TaxID=3345854 RepID=UPI003682933D